MTEKVRLRTLSYGAYLGNDYLGEVDYFKNCSWMARTSWTVDGEFEWQRRFPTRREAAAWLVERWKERRQ